MKDPIFTDQERRKYGYRTNMHDMFSGSEYIDGTNFKNSSSRQDMTRDHETFDILIEKNLYPSLGTSTEQLIKTEAIAQTHKSNLATIYNCALVAEDATCKYQIHLPNFKKEDLSEVSDKSNAVKKTIKDLNTIISETNDPQSVLQEPIKKLARIIRTDILKKHKDRLEAEISHAIDHCSSDRFKKSSSIPYKKMCDDIKTLSFEQLDRFLLFTYDQAEWQNDAIKPLKKQRPAKDENGQPQYIFGGVKMETYTEVTAENKEKVRTKISLMRSEDLYAIPDTVKRLKNTFKQAQREKLIPQDTSPFEEELNRYIHKQNAYKKLDEVPKQAGFFETIRKQWNTNQEQSIDEETKPSASQILTITDTEVKAFGSKDKAIEVRNQLMELKAGDTIEDFEKNKNSAFKKLSQKYHPDKQGGKNDAQAFINTINKYVDFDLAKKFWSLRERDRKV